MQQYHSNTMLAPQSTLSDEDYRTLASFRFAIRRFLSFSEKAARASGLTPRQHQALLGIKSMQPSGTANIADLAAFLIVHHNSTVELVNRLADAGLVARSTDAADRRRVLIRLTAEGEARLASLSASHVTELQRIRPELQRLLSQIPTS